MVPIVPIALALAQFAPQIARWLQDGDAPNAGEVAEKVVQVATAVTGAATPEAAVDALKENAALAGQFQSRMAELYVDLVKAELVEDTKRLQAVNETMRAEVGSADIWVRRARPVFIYIMGLTWFLQMGAISVVMVWKPEQAAMLIKSIGELTMMWSIALGVVGVYIKVRSDDKKTDARIVAPTALESIKNLVKRG